ncbi:ferredoxin reductase family protein [soil metagenome]
MKYSAPRVIRWIAVYLALAVAPLVLAVVGPLPAPRPFLVEFGVGLGFVGMGVLALQFVTTGRFRSIAPIFGADVVLQFHRQAGVVAFALVLAHPAVLVATDPNYLEFFDPRVNLLRAIALIAVIPALVLLLVTSLWRERVGLSYEWWRLVHGGLSLVVVFIGMVHGIQVSEYLGPIWKQGLWAGALVGLMYLVVHSRVIRPNLMKRRPYRVVEMREETPDTWTMTVEPEGHVGMRFAAGQFAWMTVDDSPYSLQQHPFSFSSSARDDTLGFTANAVGDFTAAWKDFEPGRLLYLEGPYGGFVLDPDSEGAVFIVGGIGVTPAMSILRTMRDNNDERPVLLFYGNETPEEITFADELSDLEADLELVVIHALGDPPDGWTGEEGYIDADMLQRRLPPDSRNYEYFICGPKPMMDITETALREMGVSWRQIYTERFQIV